MCCRWYMWTAHVPRMFLKFTVWSTLIFSRKLCITTSPTNLVYIYIYIICTLEKALIAPINQLHSFHLFRGDQFFKTLLYFTPSNKPWSYGLGHWWEPDVFVLVLLIKAALINSLLTMDQMTVRCERAHFQGQINTLLGSSRQLSCFSFYQPTTCSILVPWHFISMFSDAANLLKPTVQ